MSHRSVFARLFAAVAMKRGSRGDEPRILYLFIDIKIQF